MFAIIGPMVTISLGYNNLLKASRRRGRPTGETTRLHEARGATLLLRL